MMILGLDVSQLTQKEYNLLYSLISDYRKTKVDVLINEKDKHLSVACECFLYFVLSMELKYDPSVENFFHNEFGKPYFSCAELPNFNMSHTNFFAVTAVSSNMIGIDVENVNSISLKDKHMWQHFMYRFFSPEEIKYVGEFDELGARRFLECWTKKEAYYKARGTGLSYNSIKKNILHVDNIKTINYGQYVISICGDNIQNCNITFFDHVAVNMLCERVKSWKNGL